jgi:glycosyltransferase 2 family protein
MVKLHIMKKWQFWLGLSISLFFLYDILAKIDYPILWEYTQQATVTLILPGIGVYFIGLWVRAWRWHYLLRPIKSIPTKTIFPIVAMGYAGNNIFPARAGEVFRAVILKKQTDVPISASLATIIVERIFDGVVMLAFIFLNLSELSNLDGGEALIGNLSIQQIATLGSYAFLGGLLVFLLAAMFPKFTTKIIEWVTKRFVPQKYQQTINDISGKFLQGLAALRSPIEALMIFFTSVIIWLLETVKYWFVMKAFHFSVSFFALLLMNGVVNLATTIPSAPGYIGTFDKPGILVLTAYGVDPNLAAGYTLVLHFALWFPVTALGFYYMTKQGINWKETVKVKSQGEIN